MSTDTKDYFGLISIVRVYRDGEIIKVCLSAKSARDFISKNKVSK